MAELFPRRVISIDPPLPGHTTVSRPFFGELDDGLSYCIKHDLVGWQVRASEFICSELCAAIGIAVPSHKFAEMPDGTINFASQIIHDTGINDAWYLKGAPVLHQGSQQLSKIYAFDLFCCNDDRHLHNYLVRMQNNVERVFAMDFSHALFVKWSLWPVPPLLPVPSKNTLDSFRAIRRVYQFDPVAASVGFLLRFARNLLTGGEATRKTRDWKRSRKD